MTRILCAGTFDKIHTGHIEYFEKAKKLAEDPYLIIIVARDDNSERIKKKKTINNQKTRLEKVKALNIADEVVLGYEKGKIINRIVNLKPDIVALGYDQWAEEEWLSEELKKRNLNVKIVRMPEFKKEII